MTRDNRYVSDAPFDPRHDEVLTPKQERYYLASQWRLMFWRLRRHRLAMVSLWFLAAIYGVMVFAEPLSPYDPATRHTNHIHAPPQSVHLFHGGEFVGPFVYGTRYALNMDTLTRTYSEDRARPLPVRFLCQGEPYRLWGLIPLDIRLICPPKGGTLFLLGTDRLGRDMLSRVIEGARISLTVGLIGITISFSLGILFGGLSGYYGGWVDSAIQRLIEVIRSFPELPLWMALSAAMPVTWHPLWIFIGITVILGLLDWTGLARAVRSKLLALREEDYATAAVVMGARPRRVILRHLLPNFMSHLIVSATLTIPAMILGETALSFLGLGVRAPLISWGVLLNDAQDINVVTQYPWLLLPVVPVVLTVLAFNFLGDGLRDAADPYQN